MLSATERSVVESVIERDHIASKEEAAAVEIEIDALYDKLNLDRSEYECLASLESLLDSWKQEAIESKFRKSVQKARASKPSLSLSPGIASE